MSNRASHLRQQSTMNKLANMRHWSGSLSPAFMGGRQNMNMTAIPPHPKIQTGVSPITPINAADATIHYSFNVPFASNLAGPNTEDIVYASDNAIERWTHPPDAADDVPIHELPIHAQNVENLRRLCADLSAGPLQIEAHVKNTTSKRVKGQVVNVCLTGRPELVQHSRESILNETPLALRCATVDIDGPHVFDKEKTELKTEFLSTMRDMAKFCGVDIFLLGPKNYATMATGINGDVDVGSDSRWRIAIYGDMYSTEHAKTRILIYIDKLLGRVIDGMKVELSLHTIVCGRARKNIKLIESSTSTAIYFPPPFSPFYRYVPKGATKRNPLDIFITGESSASIALAKAKIYDLTQQGRGFLLKEASISCPKIDSILLGRMDKVRKIMETNGTYMMFPTLASQHSLIRIQGSEGLHLERTIRELMALTGQFYSSTWWIQHPPNMPPPTPSDVRNMLADISANSDADVMFKDLTFTITGSDDAVKVALKVINTIQFAQCSQYQIRVKIELANEHKEFVSGKKNGKINKIMGQSSVQIIFDGFNEYNFNIDVLANNYDAMKTGLDLVEQEMPASISFHVPDQYHKRIIGIGGQHIQRIMKKYSVFVKFSNAMDRGGVGREDDDIKVDNVICRTPARNAQNLELVKEEILELVDRADSEFTTQTVVIDRLYHRQLIARMPELEQLEKKWNCKIIFPSTEQASDDVTISGPEHQIPQALDDFLGMVPDRHELVLSTSKELEKLLVSKAFRTEVVEKIRSQYEVEVSIRKDTSTLIEVEGPTITLLFSFTRRNVGWIKDVVDCLVERFLAEGIDVKIIKGAVPRPKSDSFEDSLPYFDSKLLQHAPAPIATDSPTKTSFGDDVVRERGSASTIFEKLRKPGSMSSIFSNLDRRKNSSHSPAGSFFKNGSNNVSKSSLISIESTRSFNADRNPWNDSGVNLPDDDNAPWPNRQFGNGGAVDYKQAFNNQMHPGDATPKHHMRGSQDSGRPSTSHSTGYPGPIGPPR